MKITTTAITLLLIIMICHIGLAQNITTQERLRLMKATHFMDYSDQQIATKDFFELQKSLLSIGNDQFKIKSSYSPKGKRFKNREVKRYTQFHKGIEIIGGSLILHTSKNKVIRSIGQIVPGLQINTIPHLSKIQLRAIAGEGLSYALVKDEIFPNDHQTKWELVDSRLVIMDQSLPNKSGRYVLAYECDLHAPGQHYDLYIDAHKGEILAYINKIHSTPIEGQVETNYYGTQNVTVEKVDDDHYELHDDTRGDGIFTYDAVSREVVSSTDNQWNSSNAHYSKAAGDVHYSTTAYYDFMLDRFGWSGLDGNDAALISNVNVNGKFYSNAFWNGSTTNYGNGDCERFNPLTSIDIVGHEWTHGFVDYSSDLIYYDQSGALNEASADIFGKALEYAYDKEHFSWNVGQHMLKDQAGRPIRSMNDPNAVNDPAYYGGISWYTGAGDNAGVHSNSGVLNYWFYLLVEGKTGTNEKDYNYNVPAIGMDKAIEIVFNMNVGYLTENSNYFDAMYASLSVCDDLYGPNAPEREAVLEAWLTVGLFPGMDNKDLTVRTYNDEINLCPSDQKYLDAYIYNVGNQQFDMGTPITISYKQNNTDEVVESINLSSDLMPGDSIYYQFNTPILSGTANDGTAYINISAPDDLNTVNNQERLRLNASSIEDLDTRLVYLRLNQNTGCGIPKIGTYSFSIQNTGCFALPAGDSIFFKIETENEDYLFGRTLFWDLDPGSYLGGTTSIPDSIIGDFKKFNATFIYPPESMLENNSYEGEISSIQVIEDGYFEDFTPFVDENKYFLEANPAYVIDSIYDYNGNYMLALAGIRSTANYTNCDEVEDFFDQFRRESTLRYCVNTIGMEEPIFSFNYIHLLNEVFNQEIANDLYGSMFRVITDSTSTDIIYGMPTGELHTMEFKLPINYEGNLEIQAITLSGLQDPFDSPDLNNLDALLFDNIRLYDQTRIDQLFGENDFILFPNPTNSWIQIEHKELDAIYDVEIHDMLGRLVGKHTKIEHKKIIDLSDYASGLYYVSIWQDRVKTYEQKLVKTD